MEHDDEENKARLLARVIIEMLGAPKEHIEKTLEQYIEKLNSEKGIEIVKQDLAPAKEQNKLFSVFAELDIWFKSPRKLVDFCFDSMPSSVEILEPYNITLNSSDFSSTLNDLQAKIHRNDMIVKTLKAKNAILDKNAKAILMNFVYFLIKDEPRTIEWISSNIGIKPEQIKPFLNELVKDGKIIEKGGKYGRAKQGDKEKD